MWAKALQIFLVSGLLTLAGQVLACSFDTDCYLGSKCIKSHPFEMYGVCAGGMLPGNQNDRQPVYDPSDTNRTVGNTCSFDVDCGPGNFCYKQPTFALNGVCLRRR